MQKTKKEPAKGKRAGTPGVGMQACLQVRLWAADGAAEGDVPAGALAMIEDFLGVSPCEPAQAGQTGASGIFSDVVQAVNAGRRLQRMVQGYSKAANGGLGAGLLLMGGDEKVSDAEMYELRQKQALSRAQPGQMFVVGALCDKVRSIPGLQFKEIDSAFAGGGEGKPRRVMFVLPAATESRGPAEDEIKTRVVESFARTPNQESGGEARKAASLVLAPIGAKSGAAPASGLKEAPKTDARKVAGDVQAPAVWKTLWARPQVRWASVGGAALVVLVTVAMAMHGRSPAKTTPDAPGSVAAAPAATVPAVAATNSNAAPAKAFDANKAKTKAEAASAPKTNPGGPVVAPAPVANATPPPGSDATKKPDAETKTEEAKHEPEKVTPAPPPAEPRTPRPPPGSVSVSYSAEEINMLLARAEKDSGDGNYDQAIKEYQSILNHDPGNQRAKQGKERALRNKNGD